MGKGGGGGFRGTKGGKQHRGTPRNNRSQNEQTNSIARILKLTYKQQEELHRLVHGMNMGYQEMLKYAREWFKNRRSELMDKNQVNHISETMKPIINEPLQRITRAADLICFQFGDLVKTIMPVRNADGKLVPGEGFVGKYALQVACYGRLTCGNAIIFAKGDLYQPSSAALARLGLQTEDTLPDDFDYDIIGNNRLDEIINAKFDSIKDIAVKNVTTNHLGDLYIKFSNGFKFQALIDVSGPEECWRFFKSGDDEHLVVTGEGLEINNQE